MNDCAGIVSSSSSLLGTILATDSSLTSETACSGGGELQTSGSQTDYSPVHSPSKEKPGPLSTIPTASSRPEEPRAASPIPQSPIHRIVFDLEDEDAGYQSEREDAIRHRKLARKIHGRLRRGSVASFSSSTVIRPTLETRASQRTITPSTAALSYGSGSEPNTPVKRRFSGIGLGLPASIAPAVDEHASKCDDPNLPTPKDISAPPGIPIMERSDSLQTENGCDTSTGASNISENETITPSKLRGRRPAVAHIPLSLKLSPGIVFEPPDAASSLVSTLCGAGQRDTHAVPAARPINSNRRVASQHELNFSESPKRQLSNIEESPYPPALGRQRSVSEPTCTIDAWSITSSSGVISPCSPGGLQCPPKPVLRPILGAGTPSPAEWLRSSPDFFAIARIQSSDIGTGSSIDALANPIETPLDDVLPSALDLEKRCSRPTESLTFNPLHFKTASIAKRLRSKARSAFSVFVPSKRVAETYA
ncbi:hypothetical protein HGRIS_000903 [Hohenbuehelia grisea]|uniref:Uncharacterized protein n=1 Tax=Hohenbuehelia grisea TaxID=104357 RepID=A0ABR3IQ33_9AGAR